MSLPRETTSPRMIDRASTAASLRVTGGAMVYRLFDVGYEIQLDRALVLLEGQAPVRERPLRGEAQAMQIANPPVSVTLRRSGGIDAVVRRDDCRREFRLVYVAATSVTRRRGLDGGVLTFGNASDAAPLEPLLQRICRPFERIKPAIERPAIAPVSEDYVVFRIRRLEDATGRIASADALGDDDIIPLLRNESRQLSAAARRELLPHRFSYYGEDLTILTWDNALVLEPVAEDTTYSTSCSSRTRSCSSFALRCGARHRAHAHVRPLSEARAKPPDSFAGGSPTC